MCHQCRHNHTLLLAAILAGSVAPFPFKYEASEDQPASTRDIDPVPLRTALSEALVALGPPVVASSVDAARDAAKVRMQAAFAGLTHEQLADIGRMIDDCKPALTAISQLGIEELRRRADAGDTAAGDELMSAVADDAPHFFAVILGGSGRPGNGPGTEFPH